MRSSFVRITLITVIVGLVVFGAGMKSYSEDENKGKWIDVLSYHWGVSQTQFARVCVANTRSASDTHEIEQIAFVFVRIEDDLGQTLIERPLHIPVNQARCTDVTYQQLGDAGLRTEPSGRRQFLLSVTDGTSNTQNSEQPGQLKGSIETVDGTGQTRIYQGIHWSFDNTEF